MKLSHCIKPCSNCPFRKNTLKGWLGKSRMEEILSSDSFVCHKNTKLQCAGHMLIKGQNNSFVRLASSLHIELNLKGRDLVFDTEQKLIDHHGRR